MHVWNYIQVQFLASWSFFTVELSKLQNIVLDLTFALCFQSQKHTHANFMFWYAWTHEISLLDAFWTWNSWSYNFVKIQRRTKQMLNLLCIMCINQLETFRVYVENLPFLSNYGSHSLLGVLSSVLVSTVSLQSLV